MKLIFFRVWLKEIRRFLFFLLRAKYLAWQIWHVGSTCQPLCLFFGITMVHGLIHPTSSLTVPSYKETGGSLEGYLSSHSTLNQNLDRRFSSLVVPWTNTQ
jgi:hypothetical protein